MKDLPIEVSEWLDAPTIQPCFLIEITLDETLYLSTNQEYVLGDITYERGHIVGQIEIAQDRAAFGIVNWDFRHTTPALTGAYQRAPVKIWWTEGYELPTLLVEEGYFDEGYYTLDERRAPMLVFQGNVSEFNQIDTVLGIVASRSAARRYPTLRVLPPIANYVRPEGSVITLGGNTYRLEPRDT